MIDAMIVILSETAWTSYISIDISHFDFFASHFYVFFVTFRLLMAVRLNCGFRSNDNTCYKEVMAAASTGWNLTT